MKVTSQHPYAEEIGEPYVWMVDMDNQTDVERAITAILNHTVSLIQILQLGDSLKDLLKVFSIYMCLPDKTLPSLWVYMWRNAPEG